MVEKLQDVRCGTLEHYGETPHEWEKSLLKDNTEDLARFAILADQPLHAPSRGKDSLVPSKEYSHPYRALSLLQPEQPEYQGFLDHIYTNKYPDQDPSQKAIYAAFDIDAMDRLQFAANNWFQVSPDNRCEDYTEFDARFTDFRINGDNAAHITKNGNVPDQQQNYEMSYPMRLVSAAIVPMKVESELLHHQESREDIRNGIQGMLRLSDEDMRFADTLREAMHTHHEWAHLDPAINV